MRSLRDVLKAAMSCEPKGEWVIQVQEEEITIFHKEGDDLILLHFPRSSIESVALLIKELDQSFIKEAK